MRLARIFLWLAAALLALLAWRYWPVSLAPSPSSVALTNTPSTKLAVAEPKAASVKPADSSPPANLPTAANTANATAMDASRQETLDSLLQFQTALEQSLGNTTDPQDRAGLEHELTELQVQIQYDLSHSAAAPSVTTDLGEIALAEGQSAQEKLVSGDIATLTASTSVDGNWSVSVIVRHTDANGSAAMESTSLVVQPGQAAVVKIGGNEIHFTPRAAGSNLSN